ncbi:ImmA/IrrE family metallo-endopeptidase [Leuconostoc mesenteroides]|uniref:ImmA/IrrE family metallo-endopeptidase n=1 Tax=Leuconostoc mesenteroides TaxID=1245 RepID=UPI001CC0EB16|nr:ImmA/IrrE family metallo-endopeptidase [Leuconostoc mesenteroides]MBZ1505947.1 ImmA/IrrE family metallo-endopeptidase [Leuconostoc mesenteroides]
MDKKKRDAIENIAEEVRRIVMAGNSDNQNLDVYLRSAGVQVKYTDLSDTQIDGYLEWDIESLQPKIVIDAFEHPHRRVFSIAHELGHLVLHWKWVPTMDEFNKNSLITKQSGVVDVAYRRTDGEYTEQEKARETEANHFAASFLIPEQDIIDYVDDEQRDGKTGSQIILDIGERYFVSQETAGIRYRKAKEFI